MNLDKIISIIRNLNEESPTVSLGSGSIAGTYEAGDDPPVRNRKKRYAKGGKGSRKWWLQYLKQK